MTATDRLYQHTFACAATARKCAHENLRDSDNAMSRALADNAQAVDTEAARYLDPVEGFEICRCDANRCGHDAGTYNAEGVTRCLDCGAAVG